MRLLALLLALFASAAVAQTQETPRVAPTAALNHIGERAVVCGRVASTNFLANKSLVIAIDTPYPGQQFSALIQAVDRLKFNEPEFNLIGKRICSNGTILLAQGRAQMILRDPGQLSFQ